MNDNDYGEDDFDDHKSQLFVILYSKRPPYNLSTDRIFYILYCTHQPGARRVWWKDGDVPGIEFYIVILIRWKKMTVRKKKSLEISQVLCGQSSFKVSCLTSSNPQGEYGEGDPDMEGEGEYEEEA